MAIKSAKATSTSTIVSAPGVLLGLNVVDGGTAGSLVFKDGGASGTTLLDMDTAATSADHYMAVPGGGIVFDTDIHVTFSNVTSVTIFYDDLS